MFHQPIKDFLYKTYHNERLAHAYLFYGPAGVGKKQMAEDFAQYILCTNLDKKNQQVACGICDSCRQFIKKIHSDVFYLRRQVDDKNIKVEHIRQINQQLSLSTVSNYKIAFVFGAENLSISASNAFLKTLEEPTLGRLIFMVTDKIDKLPKTITSRCQLIKFLPVSTEQITDFLRQEKNIEKGQARHIADFCQGRPKRAEFLVEKPLLWKKYIDNLNLFFKILSAKKYQRFAMVDEFLKDKQNINSKIEMLVPTLNLWQSIFRDLILLKMGFNDTIIHSKVEEYLQKLEPYFALKKLLALFDLIEDTKHGLERNLNPKLALENVVLNF